MEHEKYMEEALIEAQKAFDMDEVPIGAVIVHNNEIIGRGHNRRNTDKNPLYHAEIIAINQASKFLGDWRIEDCTMYVTIEPCPMCAGAILQGRIPTVVYGAKNPKAGCCGSVINLVQQQGFNHRVDIVEGILEEKCAQMMKNFFKRFRTNATHN